MQGWQLLRPTRTEMSWLNRELSRQSQYIVKGTNGGNSGNHPETLVTLINYKSKF